MRFIPPSLLLVRVPPLICWRLRCGDAIGLALAILWLFSQSDGTRLGAQEPITEEPPAPVLSATFENSAGDPLEQAFIQPQDLAVEAVGGVHFDQPGPRSPEFPGFAADNRAVRFDGNGARLMLPDSGENSPLDFGDNDSMTVEAWVWVDKLPSGQHGYVIGKGRTGDKRFPEANQNWALRVREQDGLACVNFLFSTPDSSWHRWTTSHGFKPGSGWHHIAITYQFGRPDSIRGWIDGKAREGLWDMGGATTAAPVVDDDAVWIGSSMGGNPGNSFRGMIDSVALYRSILSDEILRSRFVRTGPPREDAMPIKAIAKALPETEPQVGDLSEGKVQYTFFEGLASHDRWLNEGESLGPPVSTWINETFLTTRLPHRYDSWGVRDGWKPPVLMRAAADVVLPTGKQTLLVRARGLSRLWINGQVVLRTKAHRGSTDGHEKVDPIPDPPAPGMRTLRFGDQETIGQVDIPDDGKCRVIVETIVGGKKFRAEPGEFSLAIASEDGSAFHLLAGGNLTGNWALTDDEVTGLIAAQETSLIALDDQTRRSAAASQDPFWESRHQFAREVLAKSASPAIPDSPSLSNPIDAFLAAKVQSALQAAANQSSDEALFFHQQVLPTLKSECFRCHGEKDMSGLRLNSPEGLLAEADSGEAAVVPGDADASELVRRLLSTEEGDRMPPSGNIAPEKIDNIRQWINSGAKWLSPPIAETQVANTDIISDEAFLRRVHLDTVGIPPTEQEVLDFLRDTSADKRANWIDRLLADSRYADHWVSYWQDVLAENPNMLKPSLNNSGPFRHFLYEALRDNHSIDRMVTELVLLRGSEREGGSAGFGLAADNDAPFASKGHVIAGAFLGIELQCARCHDSPYHSTTQRDLYSLAAMLARQDITVPPTSTVAPGFFEQKNREALIQVTLKPGEPVKPQWPFAHITQVSDSNLPATLLQNANDSREQFAAILTAPQNPRFAQVIVNRLWKQLIGIGIVEPVHDWEGHEPSHPELLQWLANELIANRYNTKHIIKLILNSQLYQRQAIAETQSPPPELQFFTAPLRRRLSAEQVVDSLFAASGQTMEVEELTFDPEARRPANTMISLGRPRRAWQFATLSNERDRPSLALPRAQAVTDVLEAFGWNASRQGPVHQRETDPSVLQPGVLSNSTMATWIYRATAGSQLAQLAVDADSPQALVSAVFLRFLTRSPSQSELELYSATLSEGFSSRIVPLSKRKIITPTKPLGYVSWSNHLAEEANSIQIQREELARQGDPDDPRLESQWREKYEDLVWSIMNSPEFVWIP